LYYDGWDRKIRSKLMTGLDISTNDFHSADGRLDELIHLLPQTREIPEPKRQKLTPYLSAGRQLLRAPIIERDLWERLLLRPLQEIVIEAPATNIGKIANEVLGWLIAVLAEQK
jgi:hypothetical protein